jgi:hypothetical protein
MARQRDAGFTLDGVGDGPNGEQPAGGDVANVNGEHGGANGGNGGTLDPAEQFAASGADRTPGPDATGTAPKRGRGRPKGSGKGKAQASNDIDSESLNTLLFNIHGMLAAATGIEQLALANEESQALAKSVANLQQFYPMRVSAKALAWTNLAMVAGNIYGSRAVAIYADMKAKEKEQSPDNGNVTTLRR